jgi:hypothetical protein
MTTLRYCKGCFAKQQKINAAAVRCRLELEEENARLKAQLRRQERTVKEGFFGASTPSSKVPVKANTLPDRQARRGGGQAGHSGHGRSAVGEDRADRVERVEAPERCPHCRVRLGPDQARYGRSSAGYQPATRAGLPALRTKISPQKVFRAEMHVLRPYIPA